MASSRRRTPSRASLADWPRLTRFYGLNPWQLAVMPQNVLAIYVEQLPTLQAEELLERILDSDMPHTTKQERRRVFRTLTRVAEIDRPDEYEKIDPETEGGRQVAAGLGIGITIERPAPTESDEDGAVESSEETTD